MGKKNNYGILALMYILNIDSKGLRDMDMVDIGYQVIGVEKSLIKVADVLLGFWYVCLLLLGGIAK